jgi:hypothetical protein
MRRAVLIAIAIAACGGTQKPEHHEAADLTRFLPATLEADKPKQGEPRSIHVRVWADAAVRANPRWKDDLADQIDYASQLLTPLVGAKLVIDDTKAWDRDGDPNGALKALAAADDGKDVTWVIGYIAPGAVASTAMSELGDAQVLGRHVIVHAWAEQPETALLAARLAGVAPKQRDEVVAAHRRHKQTVVLLHMLAESLGAIAEADPTWIQHPSYSDKQATFADRTRELLQIAIDARLAEANDHAIAHDLLEAIEKHEWGGWVPIDHDQVVAALRNFVDSAKAGKTAADVPTAAYEEFDRIRELGKRGQVDDGLRELDNLLVAYPGNATMYELKCELMIVKPGVADKATRAACARTSELAPGDPTVHFAVGEALAQSGDRAGARTELSQAATKIANLKIGQDDAWRRLAASYRAMGALTWAEEAITAGKLEQDPAAAEIAQIRARYGLRKGMKGVKPELEGVVVASIKNALELLNANKYGEADRAIAAGEHKWPAASGFEAVRCDLELRHARIAEAQAACAKALALDPDESWALYLSAVLAFRDPSSSATRLGIERLKKAIAVDPGLGQAWRALGKAYARANDEAARAELAQAYQAKFGQTLPQ